MNTLYPEYDTATAPNYASAINAVATELRNFYDASDIRVGDDGAGPYIEIANEGELYGALIIDEHPSIGSDTPNAWVFAHGLESDGSAGDRSVNLVSDEYDVNSNALRVALWIVKSLAEVRDDANTSEEDRF